MKKLVTAQPIQKYPVDYALLGIVISFSLFGLLMVYDASQFESFQSFGDRYYLVRQQFFSLLVGFSALTFFIFFDYHRLQNMAIPLFLFSVVLLLLVFIPGLGIAAGGAHRWLRIFGLTLQPIELIKLSSIIFFATIFQKQVSSWPFIIIVGLVGIIVGFFQKDLGSAIVFSLIVLSIYFIAGARLVNFLLLILTGMGVGVLFILAAPYRVRRVLAFLDPFADPQGFSYHILQVLIALGSGGLLGLGVGQSRQKFAYIPEVTTDSIFSVVGEEFGFVGGLILILLVGFLVVRSLKIAKTAPDSFGKLLGVGLAVWLGAQTVVNLAAMVSLVPLTGVPLPFISYGGSALIANLVAVGILLNISRQGLRT